MHGGVSKGRPREREPDQPPSDNQPWWMCEVIGGRTSEDQEDMNYNSVMMKQVMSSSTAVDFNARAAAAAAATACEIWIRQH